ncbi:maleylpyruvate isomerase family mycothiol-dependent enzyme [Lentzea sp. NPDC042327]|uniref:maleylpyruvate isomerase family mycothiol-dependent enzyme n=1 Tax=Lentzea sp. NPDC042327 TaxID=3154801 RepID=UPI0033EC2CC9
MGSLSYDERLATIVSETSLLVSAVDGADLSAPVPSCPGWTVNQLLRHLGYAHRWVAEMVERRVQETDRSFSKAHSVSGYAGETTAELGPWLLEGAQLLADRMSGVRVDEPIAVMAGMAGPRFWGRRMAHETVVHRFDACQALGLPFEVGERVTCDALWEWMTTLLPFIFTLRPEASALLGSGVLRFTATGAEEWLVDLRGEAPVALRHGEVAADASLSGPAFEVVLALYQRRPVDGFEVTGDAALLEKFLAAVRF